MKRYINLKTGNYKETIDEFEVNTEEQRKELKRCFNEYCFAFGGAHIWVSQRPCNNWKENN